MEERDLVEALKEGREEAFEYLLEKVSRPVASVIARHVPADAIEDVMQECWIRIFRSLHRYEHRNRLLSYCLRIAIRCSHDWWRQYGRQANALTKPEGLQREMVASMLAAEDMQRWLNSQDDEELHGLVEWTFAVLKPQDRVLAQLVFLEGYTPKEAAGILEQSGIWARVRLHRMKQKIQTRILSWLNEEGITHELPDSTCLEAAEETSQTS